MRMNQELLQAIFGNSWEELVGVFNAFEQGTAADMQKLIRFCITTEKIRKPPKKRGGAQLEANTKPESKNTEEEIPVTELEPDPNVEFSTSSDISTSPDVNPSTDVNVSYDISTGPDINLSADVSNGNPSSAVSAGPDISLSSEFSPDPDRHAYLHLLILFRARVQETLPTADNLIYETIHIYRKFDLLPGYKNLSLSNQALLAAAVEEKIAQALVNGDSAPFLERDWWGKFGLAYANNPFLHEKRELRKAFSSELIEFNYAGEQINGKSAHLPPRPFIRNFCKYASLVLTVPQLRSRMLYQLPNALDTAPSENGFPPVHIGWVKTGEFYNFSGMTRQKDYGPTLVPQPLKNTLEHHLAYLFIGVPEEVSLPLLAISLFSVVKFYFPGYPSRIDLKKENYLAVLRKQEKVTFYTIHGEQAKELAHAFAGFFTDYYGNSKPDENFLLRQSRVHDGVVILDEPFNNLASFQRITMLRDACILCTNAVFPKNKNEIAIYADTKLSEYQLERLSQLVQSVVTQFIIWFENQYHIELSKLLGQCVEKMFTEFSAYYRKAAHLLEFHESFADEKLRKIRKKYILDKHFVGWADISSMKTLLQLRYLKLLDKAGGVDRKKIASAKIIWERDCSKALDGITTEWKSKIKEGFIRNCFAQDDLGFRDRRYSNLYAAMSLFIEFLKACGVGTASTAWFKKHVVAALVNLNKQNAVEIPPVSVMEEYLSKIIVNGQVIPFRTKIYKGTLGWYNSNKNQIYLPYRRFFDSVRTYWNNTHKTSPLRHTKSEFLAALVEAEVLLAKKNGKTSSYIRPEAQAVVSPVDAKETKTETVIKLDVESLQLSEEARKELKRLSKIEVPMRSRSKKKGSGQGIAPAE